jgi:DNA polymerase-1
VAQGIKVYLAAGQQLAWIDLQNSAALEWLRAWLEDQTQPKYLHNAKFAQVFLLRAGIHLRGIKGDSLLLSYVLDPSFQGETLGELIPHHMKLDSNPKDLAAQVVTIVPLHQQMEEALTDALRCLLYDVEIPLSEILAAMEFAGIKVEKRVLAQLSEELSAGLDRDEDRIYALAGVKFNINSPNSWPRCCSRTSNCPAAKKPRAATRLVRKSWKTCSINMRSSLTSWITGSSAS